MICGALPARGDGLSDHFRFSGFGTVGAVWSGSDEADFGFNRQLGGSADSVNLGTDTDLGLQVTATATSWLSATVQGLVAKKDEDRLSPRVEWAFVKLQPLSDVTVRVGEMALPTFIVSDSLYVGYATTWERAPNEVYGLALLQLMQGADVTYRRSVGPVGISLTGLTGDSTLRVYGTDYAANKVRGGNLQLETDWVTLRIGEIVSDVHVSAQQPSEPYYFTGVGATVDHDNIVAQAEYVQRRAGDYFNITAANGWYIMGGYRFGVLTPYAIYSVEQPQSSTNYPPYQLVIPLISYQQKTAAVGLRWDAFSSIAFKFQAERINTDGTAGISFSTPDSPPGSQFATPVTSPVTVVSASMNFVF
jgi:hypothetical protein